jgi:N-acetylmuramoyl-L-alanine amidase
MKLAAAALVLLTGLLTARGQASLSKLERVRLFGGEYVRLTDWARASQFHFSGTRRSEEVRLTNSCSQLTFTMDSHKAEINGLTVFLSDPVTARNGSVFLSRVDLETALNPVLFPPKKTAGAPVASLCLDPGHGGKDPGNEEGRRQEKEYTLLLARDVRDWLTGAGLTVTLTRNGDTFVPLPDRTEVAKARDADLFVSLHFNAAIAEKDQVHGVEVYCLTPAGATSTNVRSDSADTSACAGNRFDAKNMVLAYQIQKAMVASLAVEDRGVKRARFAVLRNARVPAVLVEAGFMSHPRESKRIFDPQYRRRLARAIADGILAYKRLTDP